MAADRVKVAIGRTLNAGNYESIRVDVGLEADVREGEDRKSAMRKLAAECDKRLEEVCAPIESQLNTKK